jgi:glycosyltransferase involved in cell wall biosynthesis
MKDRRPLSDRPIRVLYVVYWGAAEWLGRSLVLPAVCELAGLGVRLTLVTFDKPDDLACTADIAGIRDSLAAYGITWMPLRYHKHPRVPATTFDVLHGIARGVLEQLRQRPDLIHARTFIGGLIGMTLAGLLRLKMVYHNEGFYPDEQVDGGVWQFGSFPHRLARSLEQRLYARADGIVVLSHRAREVIESLPAVCSRRTPTVVVPSCVDLDKFCRPEAAGRSSGDVLRLVYIGSIGYRYIFNRVARFVAVAAQEVGPLRLRVLTKADPDQVNAALCHAGVPQHIWSVASVPHAAMPAELATQQAGLFFLTQGISEHSCSPTKIGEYWAMGLPVVSTPNVSDTDSIIQRERIGVIVREHTDTEYRRTARELRALLCDPELPWRCRRAAESHYALRPACQRQVALYCTVLGRTGLPASSKRNIEGGL